MDIPNNHYYHPMGAKKGYMKMIHSKNKKDKSIINKISFTKEKITGRAGLALFIKYCKNIKIFSLLLSQFQS
jgi:mRNA deadenylase 3'-5' endonuclease subunit Ccr4